VAGEHEKREDWQADFAAAEERRRQAALSVSAAERLRWLEEALRFAAKVGALPQKDDSDRN